MYRIGVDVGGTNTDAVIMDGKAIRAVVKVPTSADVTSGLIQALQKVLDSAAMAPDFSSIMALCTLLPARTPRQLMAVRPSKAAAAIGPSPPEKPVISR